MSRVLILSSWVAFGHVGLSAATPALTALGHGVTGLPTVLLSNHRGWPHCAGGPVPPAEIEAMIGALAANGWLDRHDALLTGYLPSVAHVRLAAALIGRLRASAPAARIVVDPVLGDAAQGLYLPENVAAAVRDVLVPCAETLTPNRFELGWLTGARIETLADAARAAEALRRRTGARQILVTSPPLPKGETGLLAVDAAGARLTRAPHRPHVPHGTGDVLSALVAAGRSPGVALGQLQALIGASLGADHLRIAEAAATWTSAPPLPDEPVQIPEEFDPWPSISS